MAKVGVSKSAQAKQVLRLVQQAKAELEDIGLANQAGESEKHNLTYDFHKLENALRTLIGAIA